MDLADLVSRAAHGDRAAFASLATQYIDRCFALAYRILVIATVRRTPRSRR